MIEFSYTVRDEIGLHARPAGKLSALAKDFKSEILIIKGSKEVNALRLMMLMSLGIKCNDQITIKVTGEDEKEAAEAVKAFFEKM